ncbi:UNVERIFIED_CONTAM: D-alanyl-D-alanine carboxypeptidase-like protein [Acetivibrio alkalicellulosi]
MVINLMKFRTKVLFGIMIITIISLITASIFSWKIMNENNVNILNYGSIYYERTMRRDILCLMMAYPEYILDVKKSENGNVFIVMKSGKQILYDDGREKSYNERIHNGDLQDMLEEIYPLWYTDSIMDKNNDPGRVRVYSLLEEVYGSSKEQVVSNLENVYAGGRAIPFNNNNKAAQSLKKALQEIYELTRERGEIYSYVFPINGSFNYRVIAGTNLLSPHSFGIAIDLKSDNRDYWKWATKEQGQERLDSYPREVVKIFEENNFIWGGKWSYFDILHFEYRPEIIIKSKYFVENHEMIEPWYYGFPEDEEVLRYINLIENAIN